MLTQSDKKKVKRRLKNIQEKMLNNTDLVLLREYRKLYKNEISLFKRSWAAAWLFMYYDQHEPPDATEPSCSKSEVLESKFLAAEEAKRLFISIGKNRRLFPKELITLICSKTSAEKDDIGIIRILDNYSFVQIRDSKADEVINALNGIVFRGRTLTVNFAKPKNE
jgi:hypothetical protein